MSDGACKVPLCQEVLSHSLPSALPPDHQVADPSARGPMSCSFRCAEKWRLDAVYIAPGAFLARTPRGACSPCRKTATPLSTTSPRFEQDAWVPRGIFVSRPPFRPSRQEMLGLGLLKTRAMSTPHGFFDAYPLLERIAGCGCELSRDSVDPRGITTLSDNESPKASSLEEVWCNRTPASLSGSALEVGNGWLIEPRRVEMAAAWGQIAVF